MLVPKNEVQNYIPHRTPVVMVDALLAADENQALSAFHVENDNVFVVGGTFSESGLIENIAQTAALHAGYRSHQLGVPVPVAFIAAIKHLYILSLPPIGADLHTTVSIVNRVFDVTIVEGNVSHEGALLCKCEMRVYIKQEETLSK